MSAHLRSLLSVAREARTIAQLAWVRQRALTTHERQDAGWRILDRTRALAAPEYVLTEYAKLWFEDREFHAALERFGPVMGRSADRKYLVRSLAELVRDIPGDTAEAGVYTGATSWLICESLAGTRKTHHAFDSFEGLSAPDACDGEFWTAGDLAANEAAVRDLLTPYGARVHRGWIPDCFEQAEVPELCLAHIDVDLYEPTLESMRFLYPRLVPGGVLICDDYGFATCPGAKRAVDEYMADRPEAVVHVPTGQGLVIRR